MYNYRNYSYQNENQKNIIISCVYRSPGSSVDLFNEWMVKLFSEVINKPLFKCGNLNIDLLNSNKHKPTCEFVDSFYFISINHKAQWDHLSQCNIN